jgi:O-antigen ligase
VRASAFAIATLCLGLAFLTQARGIVIGLVLGGLVALSLGPDRVRRTWLAVLSVAGVAATSPLLLKPYHAFSGGSGVVSEHDIAVAAWGLAVLTVIAFAVGLLLALFDRGLRADSSQMREVRQLSRVALAVGAVVLVIGGLVAIGNPVTFAQQKWDQFRNLNQTTTSASTRLLTTSGQRYDLWRVAIKEFQSAPILGVGGDNYAFGYYRQRQTNRNLDDPHSLVFGLLSEDGIVGIGLFLLFIGGIAAVLKRGWSKLTDPEKRHVVGPAAAGAVLLGQSTVDWIWLIPGLTAVGVFALAVAAAQVEAPRTSDALAESAAAAPADAERSPSRRLARPAALALLLASVIGVLALFLSDAYVQRARTLENSPASELSAAQTASQLNPWSVTPHYLESSAYESMGRRGAALAQLKDALSLEPGNAATLGVVGDFMVRSGKLAAARHYYRQALALNPLDTGLQKLARIGETGAGAGRRARPRHA